MNKLLVATALCLGLASCTQREELTKDAALRLIQQEMNYPKVYDHDIFCSDPEHARKVLDANLEKEGLLTVKRTQRMAEAGKPLISFTAKASPYLLPVSETDKKTNIQKVKIADENLVQVTGIETANDGKNATVKYTTAYKNLTPFAALVHADLKNQATRTARLVLHDGEWRLEK